MISCFQGISEFLILLQPQQKNQHLATETFRRPQIVCGENAIFFHRQSVEGIFNVLGINILAAFGHNHVLLAPEKLQMPVAIKAAKIAGDQPAIHDGLRGQLGIVQVVRHHRLAVNRNFADAIGIGIENTQLDSRQRLAYGVRAKRLQVIQGERGAGLGKPVSVGDGNAEIVEKLQRRRLDEGSASKHRPQFSAEPLMNLRQKFAAQADLGVRASKRLIQRDHSMEQENVCPRTVRRTWLADRAPDSSGSWEPARRR